MDRFTISLSEDLAHQFDELIGKKGYQNRSEAVRDMLRNHDNCLETVILRGATGEVSAFANALMAVREVRHGRVNVVPVEMENHRHHHQHQVHTRPQT